MKTKIAAALFAISTLLMTSCDRQSWSDTQQLFKSHAHHDEHGDGAHGEKAHHGEKKDDHAKH